MVETVNTTCAGDHCGETTKYDEFSVAVDGVRYCDFDCALNHFPNEQTAEKVTIHDPKFRISRMAINTGYDVADLQYPVSSNDEAKQVIREQNDAIYGDLRQ